MARFIIRRVLSMFGVLVAISILTFLIFTAIPHPELSLAGRFPSEAIEACRRSAAATRRCAAKFVAETVGAAPDPDQRNR